MGGKNHRQVLTQEERGRRRETGRRETSGVGGPSLRSALLCFLRLKFISSNIQSVDTQAFELTLGPNGLLSAGKVTGDEKWRQFLLL